MLVFKPCETLLLLHPKFFTTTDSKPHLLHHHHHHHHRHVKLHFPPKAHFKSSLTSSPPPPPSDSLPPAAAGSSSSFLTTVDFLMDSGGLSYEQAIHVIREAPPTVLNNGGRNPRSVIAYFESIGFSKTTHISKLISKYPRVLVADVEKTLKPKIQMFQDYGFSESDVADLIASKPLILHRSVKRGIKPALDLIKSFVKTEHDLIKTIRRSSNVTLLVTSIWRKSIELNIDVLRNHGVPDSEIVHLILSKLQALISTPVVFKRIVERIVSLGFKPETRKFTTSVSVMSGMKKATWDSKIDLLKGLGWSDEHILDAFRRYPRVLVLSRENLKEKSIGFFKESLNWDASILSKYPIILNFSLKIRVIPRYAVLKCLMSKEIIKEDTRFFYMLNLNETEFLSKYVFKFQDRLPYLYEEVYKKECVLVRCEEDNGDIDMTVV